MNNNQHKRYKITEKTEKIMDKNKSNIHISRNFKILILIIAYLCCVGAILGLIFAILY